jgi:hypothetical protein
MNRVIRTNFLAAAAIALGTLGVASAAHARSDVIFSIGLQGAPSVYVQPAPVYVQPAPVYVERRPVYQPRPVYLQPQVVVAPPMYEYVYFDGHRGRQDEWRRHQGRRANHSHGRHWD